MSDAEDAARYRWLKGEFELRVEPQETREVVRETATLVTYSKKRQYWCIFELRDDWRFGAHQESDTLDFDSIVDALMRQK